MLELQDLFITSLLVAAGWYWWKARARKEMAYRVVKQHCEKNAVEILDESLVLTSIGMAKNNRGFWKIRRSYRFEFSTTGEYRYYGTVQVLGSKVISIELAPHHI